MASLCHNNNIKGEVQQSKRIRNGLSAIPNSRIEEQKWGPKKKNITITNS